MLFFLCCVFALQVVKSQSVIGGTVGSEILRREIPKPISVPPSQQWDGCDGLWSSFTLRLGTPAQIVRVFISTAAQSTWVIFPEGCTSNDPSNCGDLRGGQFKTNLSSTWVPEGIYSLELETNLHYAGLSNEDFSILSGTYGFDTIGISWAGTVGPVLEHQIVAGIATTNFYLGVFGITPRASNFSDYNNPQPATLSSLKEKGFIPSLSWGYTAGAEYRLNKVFGSLTLGGYDTARFVPNNISFPFNGDQSRDLTVGIQSITSKATNISDLSLLPSGIFALIDSTLPYIWLPIESCQKFERAFGLTWDPNLELYLVNDSLHDALLAQNASLTFTLGHTAEGGDTVDIFLPYAALDLEAGYPLIQNTSKYYPLKRAANDTQYTLGRTFLQEAYIITDYERSNFSVSQALFSVDSKETLVAIPPLSEKIQHRDKKPTIGLIAGVSSAVGVIGIVAITFVAVCVSRRRSRSRKEISEACDEKTPSIEVTEADKEEQEVEGSPANGPELYGDSVPELHAGFGGSGELGSEPIYEMMGSNVKIMELPSPNERSELSSIR